MSGPRGVVSQEEQEEEGSLSLAPGSGSLGGASGSTTNSSAAHLPTVPPAQSNRMRTSAPAGHPPYQQSPTSSLSFAPQLGQKYACD